jgi:hypothetical protein
LAQDKIFKDGKSSPSSPYFKFKKIMIWFLDIMIDYAMICGRTTVSVKLLTWPNTQEVPLLNDVFITKLTQILFFKNYSINLPYI